MPAGSDRLRHDLRRLTQPEPAAQPLKGAANPMAMPDRTALGASARAGGTAGIASPLTETAYSEREYHEDEATLISTSGLFTLRIKHLKRLRMVDANDQPVDLDFAAP